ncbi:MAG: hydantoinase/oxoprolinase family protein, partial [Chloroflexi bacterium]|nr:hydantoinase/oxoprolinase family protein [Chloroflexota bacterium]
MAYRLGVDIGGTFTDATLIDETTGEVRIGKVSSTPKDPSIGFLQATHRILQTAAVAPAEVAYVVHGTTVATNSIIEGKVARTGLITTDGFRDMLEIARQMRPSLYDLQFEKPRPLVPRYYCFGIPERLDARGNVVIPLDEEAVRRAAEQLRAEGVESIAVCLLHSYVNPAHEKRVGEILREVFPEAVLSLSSEVAPEFREYFRASTTVINACIRPVVARYLQSIEARLRDDGLVAEPLVMQSSGGVLTFGAASERPVFMVESGPAAGVIASTYLGGILGYKDVISFDMGGTTAKVGLIQNGRPRVTKDYEVGAAARPGVGSSRGSGYPIRTPVIDLIEIGAGGGSIAWIDAGGALRVGPQSAGA